jgi:glutathione synthase/RimK-type ligase-like ATP-grasp enzyme
MILLWGLPADGPLAGVAKRLRQLGAPAFLLDQRLIARTAVSLSPAPSLSGMIRIDGVEVLTLEQVTAAYIRPHDSRQIIERTAPEDPGALVRAAQADMTLLAWADMAPGRILNRPEAMTSNDSKPYQAAIIERHGLRVPDTLITTDAEAVRQFQDRHGELIYKSISSTRSIVSRLRVEHAERLSNLCWCPTQFQQYVAGTDFRVHVLADEIFATEIRSEADDYRYASRTGRSADLRSAQLPEGVADRCRRVAHELGLTLAGIDLRRSPDGEWYCFEVNPSPGFSYYQQRTGILIDLAVARHLAGGTVCTRARRRCNEAHPGAADAAPGAAHSDVRRVAESTTRAAAGSRHT